MASNRPAPEAPTAPAFSYGAYGVPNDTDGPEDTGYGYGAGPATPAYATAAPATATSPATTTATATLQTVPQQRAGHDGFVAFNGPAASAEEWNPTADSVAPVRGKHRVAKQRGSLARSSTVLGVGVIAAVGAGGIATAQDKPAVSISLPDQITESLGSLVPGAGDGADSGDGSAAGTGEELMTAAAPVAAADGRADAPAAQQAGAGDSLRARILQQAEQQRSAADEAVQEAARAKAVADAAAEAKKQRDEALAKVEKAARDKAESEERARVAAEKRAEAERLAKLAASYSMPVSSYTLTATYGQSGSMWSSGQHTGLDFAGQAGAPLKAVHGATVKSAGWSGSYGYRIVLELPDGTEVWYCHLSQMSVSVGEKVSTGQVIGNMGATGNVSGVHLHLEVHTPGGDGIDPAAWLRGKGLTV
ncbi:M23 family metallopeptidase [Streptomyces sp. NPDC058657]|uniref:M23 family metallopeptidase n=1 Tax=unclassified Streptomyces TaxID=2593676 RepID=UPI0036666549